MKRARLPALLPSLGFSLSALAVALAGVSATCIVGVVTLASGCGSTGNTFDGGTGDGRDATATGDTGSGPYIPPLGDDSGTTRPHACVNLECQQQVCTGAAKTTVTGKVYDPSGRLPLYNAIVYVPNAAVQPFSAGVSCDACGAAASGSPVVSAITGPDGAFTLENVPVGANIPLVLQVGRWRRQVTIPAVNACTANPITDVNLLRLPRTKTEGDIPQMAIATGSADPFECLLRKLGIADSEFTSNTGTGRVHVYRQNGVDTSPPAPAAGMLWGSVATLKKYDLVFLPCEGGENKKSPGQTQNIIDYTSAGGRVFTTHYGYVWTAFAQAPFPSSGDWTPKADNNTGDKTITGDVDRSFPKGDAFAHWLVNVNASTTLGKIQLEQSRYDLSKANKPPSQSWMTTKDYGTTGATPKSVQHITFNTPINAALDDAGQPLQCGKVVFSDFHVTTDAIDDSLGSTFPKICKNDDYTPQEKALAFMIFDLSSCIQNDDKPPTPPGIPR